MPAHVAYADDRASVFREKLRNVKEEANPITTPIAGTGALKPSESFSIVLPNTSERMAAAKNRIPFI